MKTVLARLSIAAAIVAATAVGAAAQSPADRQSTVQAGLGLRLLGKFASDNPASPNLLVSPASVAAVLAFLELGADRAMQTAIADTIGIPPTTEGDSLGDIRSGARTLGALPADSPLAFANAVFVDPSAAIYPTAIDKLAAAGMETRTADLGKPAGVDAINQWVSSHTAGLIPTLIDQPLDGAALVGLNALHFKDRWAKQFKVPDTRPQAFQLVGGGTTTVPMMLLRSTTLPLQLDNRFVAVRLPYKANGYELIVVASLGPPAGVDAYDDALDWLAGGGDFKPVNVNLSLPKFSAAMSAELLPDLDALGLAAGHSKTAFSGFSDRPIDITDVIQKTLIKVDENGTEAAAATAATIAPVALAPPKQKPIDIIIDKPFVFALREQTTGFILLSGYIGDPSAK